MIFTRALFTRLFYLYFWRTGGDIFGKGEKTAPRGHFSTFFPVLAGVMGLSTPKMGGLKDAFFGPKIMKNGHVLAHSMRPGNGPRFFMKNHQKTRVMTHTKVRESDLDDHGIYHSSLSQLLIFLEMCLISRNPRLGLIWYEGPPARPWGGSVGYGPRRPIPP